MKEDRVKISVGVITYKQEKTIRQTLESILSQVGDFDLEVVVGEDHSPDSTRAVCDEYATHYSLPTTRQVILLDDEPNMGIMRNFARVMKACTGDYIGICAGDDYWCDTHKLEKQLAFLTEHPDYGVCTCGGYRLLVKKNQLMEGIAPYNPVTDGDVRERMRNGFLYAMPLTLLFRRELLQHIDWNEYAKRQFSVEDVPMQFVMGQHAKWGHVSNNMVVYRVYKESATFISFDHPKYLFYHRGIVAIRQYLDELFPGQIDYSETWAKEYLFYTEFLQMLHQDRYEEAKMLAIECDVQTKKVLRAKRIVNNRLVFEIFRMYKKCRE